MNRRTSLIAAAAITGTVLAGTTAVAANVGILNSADSDSIGDLSAVAEVAPDDSAVPTTPQVIDIYVEEPVPSTTGAVSTTIEEGSTGQEYRVDDAGSVTVERTASGLVLADVAPSTGWEWTSEEIADGGLTVTFTNGESTYVFTATLTADGSIDARVDEPVLETIVVPAATPPATAPVVTSPDDDHDLDDRYDEYDEYDDDEYDDIEGYDDHDDEYDDIEGYDDHDDEDDDEDDHDSADDEDDDDEDDDEEYEGGDDDD